MWDKAVAYCRQAGEKAMASWSARREALGYFEQALGVLEHLPETRDTREQAIDLRLALRSANIPPSGDPRRVLVYLREAEALAAALDDPRRLGRVSAFLVNYCCLMGVPDQAIAAGQRALALATASGDIALQALAHYYLGFTYWLQGAYQRAIDCLQQTVASLDGERRRERCGLPVLPVATARAMLAICYAELGRFTEGIAYGEEGRWIAEAIDHAHPGSLMVASWGGGLLALRQGDLPRALPQLERAVSICQEVGFPAWFLCLAPALGAAYTLSGRVADAVPLLTQALELAIATEIAGFQALCSLALGEAQLLADRLDEAQALAEQVLALTRAHQERGHETYALHLLGDIAARREPPEREEAEARYQQALALADELGMRPLQAHCHRGLGTLYAATGQREQARTALSTAIAMYRAMEMTFWLPQTEASLVQVKGH